MTPENFESEALVRVKLHEGYRANLYRDPLDPDILTGGYGHNFNEPISPSLADKILSHDWEVAKNELGKAVNPEALNRLPYHKYFVLAELMFQLGFAKFKGFKKMIAAIHKGNIKEAARELRDSLYYKQVTNRVEELAKILES
jgi:GH24 family phage-related lysozyme (muramidase)